MTIEEILALEEGQTFDRKSIRIDAKTLAEPLCAFANSDGGIIAIGITNTKKQIEGVDGNLSKLNDLLRVPIDYCNPTVEVRTEMIPCIDMYGKGNHVLLMHVEPSMQVHANQADEVFMRVGDKSKRLSFDDRIQLMYDKGMRYFEDTPVADAELDDIDMDFVKEYIGKIGYGKTPLEYLKENKGFVREKNGNLLISTAAILLFGKYPQTYYPRARVRFIRYEGIEEKFGTQMNVIKDVSFEGNILKMAKDSIAFLDTQIKEKTYLGQDGTFVTEEEYPKFVRQEIIVNAVTHRDYSIKGTDIQVKMFDDRIVVESPGKLPGLVKPENIRSTHFSRNPKIAEFLKAYKYVKEYGEGVNRMFNEMQAIGLPEPVFYKNNFMLHAIVRNNIVRISENEYSIQEFENLPIEEQKVPIEEQKVPIGEQKVPIGEQKVPIELIEKFLIDKSISEIMKNSVIDLYNAIESNRVFGRKEVSEILDYSDRNAGKIIALMKSLSIIEPVTGKGKGKYIFKYKFDE